MLLYRHQKGFYGSFTEKAKGLLEAAKAKKEELTKGWPNFDQGVPKMVAAIKNRVDMLFEVQKAPCQPHF